MKLEDTVAIVTGAAGGMGRAISLTLAREGASIVLSDVAPLDEAVDEVVRAGGRALALKADVTRTQEIETMVGKVLDKWSKIDILVNNAGGSARERASLFHLSREDVWDMVIGRNLKGTLVCSRAVINHMMVRKTGRIVNIASVVGVMGGAGVADYSAAKAGVIGFTKSLAREANPYGINVNAVAPGLIKTAAMDQLPQEMIADLLKKLAINRVGLPQDVANAVLFFCCPDSSYVTGQVLGVCGGGYIP